MTLTGTDFALAPYGAVHLGLIGAYQLRNALLAVTAVESLEAKGWRIDAKAIGTGLARPGGLVGWS